MSAATWLKKYYPKPAEETTVEEAAAHSLRKWEGVRPEVLRQHGLVRNRSEIYTSSRKNAVLPLSGGTCALCYHHEDYVNHCPTCPIVQSGHLSCFKPGSAYWRAINSGNAAGVLSMIRVLRDTVKYERTTKKKKGKR